MLSHQYSYLSHAVRSGKKEVEDEVMKIIGVAPENYCGLMDPDDPTHRHQNGLNDGRRDEHHGSLSLLSLSVAQSYLYFRNIDQKNLPEYRQSDFIHELIAVVGDMFQPDTYNLRQAMKSKGVSAPMIDCMEIAISNVNRSRSSFLLNAGRRTGKGNQHEDFQEFIGNEIMRELILEFEANGLPRNALPSNIVSTYHHEIWSCFDIYRGIVGRFVNGLPGISDDLADAILLRILQNAVTHPVFLDIQKDIFDIENEVKVAKSLGLNVSLMKHSPLNKLLRMGDAMEAMRSAHQFIDQRDVRFKSYYATVKAEHSARTMQNNSISFSM